MAKKKNYYYVLVFTNGGPVYVTSINSEHKYAHWDKDKAPLCFDRGRAEDLVFGLNLNFNSAVLVVSPMEIENHPYRYEEFDISFVDKKEGVVWQKQS